MKFQIKNILIFSLSITLCASVTQALEANEDDSENNIIVVKGTPNLCSPEVMKEKLRFRSISFDTITMPGHIFPGDSTSHNPNFFNAFKGTMIVSVVDPKAIKFKFEIKSITCAANKCATIFEKYSDLNYEKDVSEVDDGSANYKIVQEVKFEQIFNAQHEDVKVSCPLETCTGIVIESEFGRIFYTATHSGKDVIRRLVVHGGTSSKMTTADDDEGDIVKCEIP